MGADIRFYIEQYNDGKGKWEHAGAYNKKGEIVPLLNVRAHNYEEYLEDCPGVDPIGSGLDVSEEVFEKFRDHFDPNREEYDGIYKSGTVTLAEMERQYFKVPKVEDYDADDSEWVYDEREGLWKPPVKDNPLKYLYKYTLFVADMMWHWVFDDRKIRLVFFCDN